MQKVLKRNREVIEAEYLALLLNKSELIDLVQIRPIMLLNKKYQRIFSYILTFWRQNHYLSVDGLTDADLIDEYVFLYNDTLYDTKNSITQLEESEKAIEKFYKEDKINELNEQLKGKSINYDKYIEEIKRLDTTSILTKGETLTKEELEKNIRITDIGINLNKYPMMSGKLKLLQNDLLIIGATTGIGKSAFLLNLMNDLMSTYQCVYFNLEMSKANIYRRLLAINKEFAVYGIDNPSEYQAKLIIEAEEEIEKAKVTIINSINNVLDLKRIINKIKDKNKHTIIFIDHIGLLKYQNKKSIYEEATEIVKELRKICLEYDCTIISASQLNRTAYTEKELSLNMLKDSGEIENSSRKIILLSYENKLDKESLEPVMNIDIAKNDSGQTGIIKMKYYKTKQVFKEIEKYG